MALAEDRVGVRVFLVARNRASADELQNLLKADRFIIPVGETTDSSQAVREVRNRLPDVILVEVDALPTPGLQVAEELLRGFSNFEVILVADQSGLGIWRDALRLGVADFLVKPLNAEELGRSVRQARQRLLEGRRGSRGVAPSPGPAPASAGRLIVVASARGGSGKTVIGTGLATLSAQRWPDQVVLVDLNLQFGDVDLLLGVESAHTIRSLKPVLGELRRDVVERVLQRTPQGLLVLLAPTQVEEADAFNPAEIESLLRFLKDLYPLVIVDTASQVDGTLLTVFREADEILMVTTPEVPALRDCAKLLRLYREHRYPMERVRIVVNRRGRDALFDDGHIQRTLGRPITATLPDAPQVVAGIVNSADPITDFSGHALATQLEALVNHLSARMPASLIEGQAETGKRPRRGLLGRLVRR